MTLAPHVTVAIVAHAQREAPHESCGFVIEDDGQQQYVPCLNTSSSPIDQFVISDVEAAVVEQRGSVLAVVHSHPSGCLQLSPYDRVMMNHSQLPWALTDLQAVKVFLPEPEDQLPLLGRDFIHGAVDCFTLIRDYYRMELGIQLPNFERDDDWWKHGQDLYMDNFARAGFRLVEGPPEQHDVILMALRSSVANHGAVYLGQGVILHHVMGRKSTQEQYLGFWPRITRAIVRHRTL